MNRYVSHAEEGGNIAVFHVHLSQFIFSGRDQRQDIYFYFLNVHCKALWSSCSVMSSTVMFYCKNYLNIEG